ncbi:MAG TPA: hypothetical protein VE267_04110 [Bradyrhizobium sp.]|nr:hypothetical protein [Bradyrhizobium sp.]
MIELQKTWQQEIGKHGHQAENDDANERIRRIFVVLPCMAAQRSSYPVRTSDRSGVRNKAHELAPLVSNSISGFVTGLSIKLLLSNQSTLQVDPDVPGSGVKDLFYAMD